MRRCAGSVFSSFGLFAMCALGACVPRTTQVSLTSRVYAGHEPLRSIPIDVNGDGRLDLVTTRSWGRGEIAIRLGNGDGTFSEPSRIPGAASNDARGDARTLTAPVGPVLADFNGDGKVDMAAVDFVAPGQVSLMFGRGDGTFSQPVQILVGAASSSLRAGDVNGDGKQDLVASAARPMSSEASEWIAGKFIVMLGHGDGTFDAPLMSEVNATPVATMLGDWDGDGKLDAFMVIANQNRNQARFLKGLGNGQFVEQYSIALPFEPAGLSSPVDLNGDGHQDLVIGVTSGVLVYLGDGANFTLAGSYYTERSRSAWVTDMNKDGKADIVTGRRLLVGDGTGHFRAEVLPHPNEDDSFVAAADFNGDGWVDIAATDSYHNQILVYLNRGGNVAAR